MFGGAFKHLPGVARAGTSLHEVVLGPVPSSVTPRQRHRSAILRREGGRGQPDAHRGGRGFHSRNCGKR